MGGQTSMSTRYPNIAKTKNFDGKMPAGFVNDVRGWNFSEDEIKQAAIFNRLLTMDIDTPGKQGTKGKRDGLLFGGLCDKQCPHCFRRTDEFEKVTWMGWDEQLGYLKEAKALGLRSVKLIGPGEPLLERGLIGYLERLNAMGITVSIFTKGDIIGDDENCMKIHGMNGGALAAKLRELGVSILLGTTSFMPELEDASVGKNGYHAARDLAIIRLAAAGFNDFIPGQPTRLAFVCTPVTPTNIDEVFDMYVWARERNIQPVMAPTMIAGGALDKLSKIVPARDALIGLYVRINVWAIMHGVYTLDELMRDGVAAYAGGACCNQVAVGVFMRGDGKVLRCPGDDITILGDLHDKTLTEIWNTRAASSMRYAGKYNVGCPPKYGISFPPNFFEDVLRRVVERCAELGIFPRPGP
ncbi:Uncharacterised protein [Candidatus Burarchaeum australiense]|nr:Uncharacterised protein [Candidatus Burarchaeum australiense]